ncbi:MAG: Asp-tRNA(Asn)/Glu-tRNA(Gln) amidotransferase GatCAB subunit B, partial [Candidatus Omnitrophica bacterium]|nr:Asp-tRNA(Asn)/Glu-tRNA(Gln) amidotransferase GatCAB subunit B [Candidatus Omnitrophota bacterium]
YRYFPEPDLTPFTIDKPLIDTLRGEIPEMPNDKLKRFKDKHNISEYDASVLVTDKAMSDFFESCLKLYPEPKKIVNWLMGDISKFINADNKEFKDIKLTPEMLVGMLRLIDNSSISGKIAKEVVVEMLSSGKTAEEIVKEKGLAQITDESSVLPLLDEVIEENGKVVSDYLSGKKQAFGFLVGQLMKKTKGKVNPKLANELLQKRLKEKK